MATPYTSHPVKLELLRTYLAVTTLGFIGAIAAFTWAIFRWYFAYHHFGPAVVGRWTTPTLILSLVLAAISAIGLILYMSARRYHVITNETSLQIKKRNHAISIPWEEIEFVRSSSIRYGVAKFEWGNRSTLWVHTSNGQVFRFMNNLMDFNSLAEAVKAALYPRYLARYREDLNQGQSIDFGPIQLTPNGIVFGRKECHWSTLEDVSLARGRLTITAKEGQRMKSYSIPARKIPNSDLCAQLIQNIEY
ncbi:MAG: hypothetical protein E3J30_11480 [Anaerolineales bacterium]|nr:MAG: hypothetical protein E3J30_11480 [Anaerolineales bacterium]